MKRIPLLSLLAIFVICRPCGSQEPAANQNRQERLSHEVRDELVTIPQLTIFDHLKFKVEGPNVTLMGYTRDAFLKSVAERRVKDIEGVEEVSNEIEVLPATSGDERIRWAVAHAIFNDNRLFRYSMAAVPPIHIIVSRGHVTLEGVVANETDKDTAGIRAKSVPGIFSVQNNLQVEQQ
jgi:osmotically-inducible protein OsmY